MKNLYFFMLFPLISFGQTQLGLDINGQGAYDNSGWSVSISSDGSTVAIGAFANNDNGIGLGSVRVYENIFGVWTLVHDKKHISLKINKISINKLG